MNLNKRTIIYFVVILAGLIIAARFPITNDEAYYIAFARSLQLSYIDAPPFVAYLSLLQVQFGLEWPIFVRLFVVVLHLLSTLLLMLIVKDNLSDSKDLSQKLLFTFLIAYLVPIFGLYGIFILPDVGLILALSIMLFAANNIFNTKELAAKNILLLGLGIGIGGLSKYHILPLGGGILLGLLFDLLSPKFKYQNLLKLAISGLIGLVIAAPVFIWNYNNHYASFLFQLQHGFRSDNYKITRMLMFILGATLYITPWFTYMLLRYGLFVRRRWFLLISFFSLAFILLFSSLRKDILPHWIAPAFWVLIPYTIIELKNLKTIQNMCKYTSIIWILLFSLVVFPGGMDNIKKISKQFNQDISGLADLLLWQDLPALLKNNLYFQQSLHLLKQESERKCNSMQPIIATNKWYFAAQLEYNHIVPINYKVLNLDAASSNFYVWRDNLSDYANCPILFIAYYSQTNIDELRNLIDIRKISFINGIGDYKSTRLVIINGYLKNSIVDLQQNLIQNPHY